MRSILRTRTKGQTIALVGLLVALGVLIGLVALAFDGGSALLQRRTMQNAAEAGAIAAATLMSDPNSVLGTCDPPMCRPTYTLRESTLLDPVTGTIATMVNANRGGTTGAASYRMTVEYHYITTTAALCGNCGADGYGPAPQPGNPQAPYVPDYVDGVRVTASVDNPTTFAKAFFSRDNSSGIGTVTVSAKAAGRIFPTCAEAEPPGVTLPFTRLRPAFEQEYLSMGNDPQHPYVFWTSNPDVNGSWKQTISLRTKSCFPACTPTNTNQLLTAFDMRSGQPPPTGNGVGGNYQGSPPQPPNPADCTAANPNNCADMGGIGDMTVDDPNWMYWQWNGTISITNTHLSPPRPGDWAENYQPGDLGNNLGQPIRDMITKWGTPQELSGPPYNLGKAVDRTMYLFGPSLAQFTANGNTDSTTLQTYDRTINAWKDTVLGFSGGHYTALDEVDRVRFTWTVKIRFYEGLQNNNSQVVGLLLSRPEIGPQNGGCGWGPGNGVYSRQVAP